MFKKKKAIDEASALLEMYKAGFVDGYKYGTKTRISGKKLIEILNKPSYNYFQKRFKINFKEDLKND